MRLPRLIFVTLALLIAYWLWPLYTVAQIRSAMISGDTATLARKIEWEPVRASLKASISPQTIARLEADPNAPQPGLWQRIKSAVAPHLANSVIDRYVTPENLPVLLGYRQIWRGTIRPALGYAEPPTLMAGTLLDDSPIDRFATFWKRLRRGVIYSWGKVLVELEDKYHPGRTYIATMELRGFEWKLTELTIGGTGL